MDKKSFFIDSYVHIRDNRIYLNGKVVFSLENTLEMDFLKQAYKRLELKYPKYHKMDRISKLGILATSVLFDDTSIAPTTALVFSNATSSLDTDRAHFASMKEIVSPAIFVYTLPNIVMGEISIRYHLQSENSFFISRTFNAPLLADYSEILLNTGKAAAVVSGWIDLKNEEYDVFLCLIKEKGEIPFSAEKLEQLYRFENE
ncbi:hypothetical protein FHG64_01000 [Antarcticibacterium flavum]|uniref:3-oxoacyl-ACP synthase n=1 Tax=Antarcticibacterium flavum TaxID=2058175 RepID=A0A5B7X092_9FLAO|nr:MULTISPECIES: hypothetical protein [Antarcticibacterium]MCM4158824.1 hypothetical protein [Antarcticibacterium sp. W02-3]QCY68088.1 hypothetical protein FHG64_01000 [Antarcticibacterium flavum]